MRRSQLCEKPATEEANRWRTNKASLGNSIEGGDGVKSRLLTANRKVAMACGPQHENCGLAAGLLGKG